MNAIDQPLVSILMPSYNHSRYVRESIWSVINQTYRNIEIIVIDDGSRDNSCEIISEIQAAAPVPMILKCIENSGVINALNYALSMAKGDFVLMLATDDRFKPEKIERHLKVMLDDDAVVLSHADVEIIDENGNLSPLDVSSRSRSADGDCGLDVLLGRQFIRFSPMVRMRELRQVGGFDVRYQIEDWPLYLKMANMGRVRYINEKLTERRVHENNWSASLAKLADLTFANSALEVIKELSPDEGTYRKAAVNHMLPSMKAALYSGSLRNGYLLGAAIVKRFPGAFLKVAFSYMDGIMSYIYSRHMRVFMPAVLVGFISRVRSG